MLRAMFARAALVLAVLVGMAAPARAQRSGDDALRAVAEHAAPPGDHAYPVVELVTMGVGSLIWERHGHIALCVVYADPAQDTCFNYGVADFTHPLDMTLGFFRGTHSFWADRMDPNNMLAVYAYADRTIWVQPLPLTPDQKQKTIERLEHDILPDNRYYAYDHFWDNCTTRIRDIIDDATGGSLRAMTEPSDGKTYRDLAREGFIGMPSMSRTSLLITDIAMGRVTDRVPTYYERMFLPQFLREAVAKKFGVQPVPIYMRRECAGSSAKNCIERGVDVPDDGPSGRVWFALIILVLTAPAWATRKWGRFQRTGMAFAVISQFLLGLILWVLAIISPLPYVHWNETCLVLLPLDLCLLFLRPVWRRKYARARVVELGLCAALLAVGVLKQPLWEVLLWPLIPAAVVGFWPERDKK
jgi:hypothetical protein